MLTRRPTLLVVVLFVVKISNEFLFKINSLTTHLSSIKDRLKKERKTFFFDVV